MSPDLTRYSLGNNLCYEILESVKKYLNIPEVKKELGAQVDTYESCNMQINFRFQMAGDWMRPYHQVLPPLLEDGLRILIYAGDADFICNWMGNKAWTLELPWSGQKEFQAAEDKIWYSDLGEEEAGEVRAVQNGNFTFLRAYGGGHMVSFS
jgi:cathepsin A (carboxypeptidase C)